MKRLKLLTTLLALTSTLALAELPVETHGNLEKLVPELVQLLEAKKYVDFLEATVPPDYRAKVEEKGGVKKLAEQITGEKAERILTTLKALKELKPGMSEDGMAATYKVPEKSGIPQKNIAFVKVKDRWYIKN